MLRKIRITVSVISLTLMTLLFLDFTGTLHAWFGWMAKIQILSAIMASSIAIVAVILVTTLLFGRVYCSSICPLGLFQDFISWISRKHKKNRFAYTKAKNALRYTVLALFILMMLVGLDAIAVLLAPYSVYGLIASNIFAPLYQLGNNVLAYIAERMDSYAFYSVDVWVKSALSLAVASVILVVVVVFSWRGGRTLCNTICPAGAILGFFSRFSIFRPVINTEKCNGCTLCEKNCKSSCINAKEHKIDYSRCVVCFDCVDNCRQGAISFESRFKSAGSDAPNKGRRGFLTVSALFAATAAIKGQEKKVDGGLAVIQDKKIPAREVSPKPAGALSLNNFREHCTACQLCVSVCPNSVLRPSTDILTFLQPEMSYERGYCRPECTKCSEVCPTGAILPVSRAEKSSIQIGRAIWIKDNCVVNTDGVSCGNCAAHCPTGAITMVSRNDAPDSPKVPSINHEKCIGCGACENLCPARPLSAIYVEGNQLHREL